MDKKLVEEVARAIQAPRTYEEAARAAIAIVAKRAAGVARERARILQGDIPLGGGGDLIPQADQARSIASAILALAGPATADRG